MGLVGKTEFAGLNGTAGGDQCLVLSTPPLPSAGSISADLPQPAELPPGAAPPASQLSPCPGITETSGRLLQEAEMGKDLT